MAPQRVELEYTVTGNLVEGTERLADATAKLGTEHKKTAEQIRHGLDESGNAARKLNGDMGATVAVVVQLGKASKDGGFTDLASNLAKSGKAAADARQHYERLAGELKKTTDEKKRLSAAIIANEKEYIALNKAITDSGVKHAAMTSAVEGNRKAHGDLSAALTKVAADEVLLKTATTEAAKAMVASNAAMKETVTITNAAGRSVSISAAAHTALIAKLKEAGVAEDQLGDRIAEVLVEGRSLADVLSTLPPPPPPTIDGVLSLQKELRAARDEAGRLAAVAKASGLGIDSDLAVAAQKNVARLVNEVRNLNDRFAAFDPGRKLQAFNQLSFSLISGFSAIQGIAGIVGGENEQLQKTLFTFQSILFASSGIQQFLGGFQDSLKTIRVLFGLTTAAVETNTGAQALNTRTIGFNKVAVTQQAGAKVLETGAKVTNTGATIVNTGAAVVNTGAVGVQGTVAVGTAGAFNVLTAAVRRATVAMLTNPYVLVAIGIAALGAAIFFAGEEGLTAQEKLQKLNDELTKLGDHEQEIEEFNLALRDSQRELEKLAAGDDLKKLSDLEQESATDRIASLNRLAAEREKDAEAFKQQIVELASTFEGTKKELEAQGKELTDQYNAFGESAKKFRQEAQLLEAAAAADLVRSLQAQLAARKADARAQLALREELVLASRDLDEKALAAGRARAGENDPLLRAKQEKFAADEEIDEMERGFKRKIAQIELQKRLGVKAFTELSELEREARLDALIAQEDIALPLKQQAIIDFLRLVQTEKTEMELNAIILDQAQERANLMAEGAAKERAVFKADMDLRKEQLKAKGFSELEIEKFVQQQTEAFELDAAKKAITLDAELQTAIINGRERGAETQKEFERKKQLDLLAIKIAAAQAELDLENARLAARPELDTDELKTLRQNLQNVINDTTAAREKLKNTPLDINLLDLLGIDPNSQDDVKAALQNMVSAFLDAFREINAARLAEVEAQISATDQIISDQQRRRSELQDELEAEQRDRDAGLANNVDRVRQELAANKAAEAAALAEKKRLLAEKQKLARQQAAIDSIVQASSLISAAASALKEAAASGGPAGIIIAIATIAGMIASFIALQAKVRAATAQGYYRGTTSVRRAPGERPGIDTVHAMLTEEEAVIPVSSARRYRKLVRGLVNDDFRDLKWSDVRPIIASMQIRMNEPEMERIATRGMMTSTVNNNLRTVELERRVVELTDEVRGLRKDGRGRRPTTTISLS